MTGIYMIKNKLNNKIYVGQSSNIENRWWKHKSFLNKNTHHNKRLQEDWNKYGKENFMMKILEECPNSLLNEREIYWINHFNSFENGYNLNIGGTGINGYKHTFDEIFRMRLIKSPMPVLQFDLNFNLIKEWIGGASHASKEMNYAKDSIMKRCKHLYKEMTPYKNFYWIFKKEYQNKDFTWDRYLNNEKIIEIENIKKENRRICQYDLNRNLIKIWSSYKELEDNGYTRNVICSICNHSRGKQTHKNFIWAFEGYDFSDGYFDIIGKSNNFTKNKKK